MVLGMYEMWMSVHKKGVDLFRSYLQIFTSLREERRLLAKRKIEELKAEQDSL